MNRHEHYESGVGPIYSVPLIDVLPLNPEKPDGMRQQMASQSDLDAIYGKHDRVVAAYEVLLHHWRFEKQHNDLLRVYGECTGHPDCTCYAHQRDALAECRKQLQAICDGVNRRCGYDSNQLPLVSVDRLVKRYEEERVRLVSWIFDRLGDCQHGCLTGYCQHDRQSECVESVIAAFMEEDAESREVNGIAN